jgi:hypothetical protein
MQDMESRVRRLEIANENLGGEIRLLRQELQHLGDGVDKLNATFSRIGWIIGGGFISAIVAWVLGGGLAK